MTRLSITVSHFLKADIVCYTCGILWPQLGIKLEVTSYPGHCVQHMIRHGLLVMWYSLATAYSSDMYSLLYIWYSLATAYSTSSDIVCCTCGILWLLHTVQTELVAVFSGHWWQCKFWHSLLYRWYSLATVYSTSSDTVCCTCIYIWYSLATAYSTGSDTVVHVVFSGHCIQCKFCKSLWGHSSHSIRGGYRVQFTDWIWIPYW